MKFPALMKTLLKILGLLGIAAVLLFTVALVAFYHLIQVGEFRRFLIGEVEKETQMRVALGEAELEMGWVMGVALNGIVLIEPESGRPVVTARKVLMRVALLPLLEKRIVFYETRLYHPTFRVAGRPVMLDLLLRLLLRRQPKDAPFDIDLHGFEVEKGTAIFMSDDEQKTEVVRLEELDLRLRRAAVQGPAPRESGATTGATGGAADERALDYVVKTAVERNGRRAGLASQGKIVFPENDLLTRRVWLDAEVRVESMPAEMPADYFSDSPLLKAVGGTLRSRFHWRGSLAEKVQIRGAVDFRRLKIDAGELFSYPLSPGDGRLDGDVEWTPGEVRLSRLDLRSSEISLNLKGSVRSWEEKDPYLELHLTSPFLPFPKARGFFPSKLLGAPQWAELISAVDEGEIKLNRAGVAGRLSEIRRLSEPGREDHLWLDVQLRDIGGDPPGDRYLRLKDWSGQIVLEKGVLYGKGFKGRYGRSLVQELETVQKGVLTGRGLLELKLRGDVHLGELREQMKLGHLSAQAAEVAKTIKELGGRGKVALSLRSDFSSAPHFDGKIALENAWLSIGDFSFSQMKGDLFLSPKEIRTGKVAAFIAGSPIQLQLLLKDYRSKQGSFDLTAESPGVKAGEAFRLLFSRGSPQDPGMVGGQVRYRGSLSEEEKREFSGALELNGVQVPWKIFAEPIRQVRGRVRFDGQGIDFQNTAGQVAGYPFRLSGRWRYRETPQFTFAFMAPEMDIAALLLDTGDGDKGDGWGEQLQAKGKIRIDKGEYQAFEFSDLRTDLSLDRGLLRLEGFSARSLGGTVQGTLSYSEGPAGPRFAVEPKIQAVPVQGFLGWFDLDTTELTGKVNLEGRFETGGKTKSERKKNLNGAFSLRVEEGVMRRLRILVRVLSFLDLSRWFTLQMPDLNNEGISFRSITGDFKVTQGVYSTENLFVDSDDLRITGAGKVDGSKGEIDFLIAVRPFPRIDTAVNIIPLIGQGLAAIKNSLLLASFNISGPLDDPLVTPAPLGTLSEFFFSTLAIPKSLIPLPKEEKK